MYADEELLPISALQHILFCERQCALIYIERAWKENRLTTEGRQLHERVDAGGHESRKNIRLEYSVALYSYKLGISGYADMVEYHQKDGAWLPYPVEFKHGAAKESDMDRVQLCAQALCLEEMMHVSIDEGALFYGAVHRRIIVRFDERLITQVRVTADRLHTLIESGMTPMVAYAPKCRNCSLLELCMPPKKVQEDKASRFVRSILNELKNNETRP